MHFQDRRKIQNSTSFAQCGASSGGLDYCTFLQTSRGVRNGNLTETVSLIPKYFSSVDCVFVSVSKLLMS